MILYANDANEIVSRESADVVIAISNICTGELYQWCINNGLNLNLSLKMLHVM